MSKKRALNRLIVVVVALAALIGFTGPKLASSIRFGLEFRGGYEIYYVVSPAAGKSALTAAEVIATADVLRKRADAIGMAEPDIHVEGENHIRVKLAGLTSADESRSLLGSPVGLPAVLTEKYTQTVGSVLGNTALKETMTAAGIGIACVFLLLLVLYRGMGAVAVFSTVSYLWLLVALFNAFHATLSLSAVVAFVLGIGMAADASIICFERVREDLARGHDPATAVSLGFKESFPTIRDANLVTALAMIALFVAGIGPIQGFSLTMLASIAISIGTNFFLARLLCGWLARSEVLSPGLLVGGAKKDRKAAAKTFDFIRAGRATVVASAVVIAAGALYYKAHGFNLDIDFTAGTALDIDLGHAIDQDAATRVMTVAGTVPATVAIGGKDEDHIAARFDEVLKPADLKAIISAFKGKYGDQVVYEENTADPGVAREFATHALFAVLAAFASIALYIGVRFSWPIAIATVVPIFHDVLLVSAVFALFKFEVDVTYIAAMLTVIGYSLNDKIVIFGRIRENTPRLGEPGLKTWHELVNTSIRQTLGRSIYTVLTVVMASACLYQFACEPLEMFALALIIGLISGAYSSIFLSSLLWLTVGAPREPKTSEARAFATALVIVTTAAITAWVVMPGAAESTKTSATAAPAVALTAKAAPLGDLSKFISIATDSQALVKAGKAAEAKNRIKDLETAWDEANKELKAQSTDDWTSVDKSIDRTLALLRSGSPDAGACDQALATLISKMSTMSGVALAKPAAAAGPGPLGDLSPFAMVAQDTLKIAESGDFPGAKTRIKDLETAWDAAEEVLRAKSAEDWAAIDKAIDRALSKARSGTPDKAEIEGTLKTLVAKLEAMQKAK